MADTTPREFQPLWDAMKASPGEWIETTPEQYWHNLEAVPPFELGDRGAFLTGEPMTHNAEGEPVCAAFYLARGYDLVLARYMTPRQFRAEFCNMETH